MSVDPLPAIKAPASTAPDAFNVHHWKCRLSSKSRLWHKRGTLVWIKVSGNVSTGEMKVPAVSRISKIGAALLRGILQGRRISPGKLQALPGRWCPPEKFAKGKPVDEAAPAFPDRKLKCIQISPPVQRHASC